MKQSERITTVYSKFFLCGHIEMSPERRGSLESLGWNRETVSKESYAYLRSIYYESFIDSLLPENGDTARYTMPVGRRCAFRHSRLSRGEFHFELVRLHLFTLPYGITLWAAECEVGAEADISDVTLTVFYLRDVGRYAELLDSAPLYLEEIQKIVSLTPAGPDAQSASRQNFLALAATGNKLKTFQIYKTDNLTDELLYEVGTLSPIGCVADHANLNSPSEKYFREIIDDFSVSVFNNWKALSLVDTTSVIMLPQSNTEKVWETNYFPLIYIHVLYQKTLLFVLNQRFISCTDWKATQRLFEDMKEHESRFAFSEISYNFLPQLLYKVMDRSMDVNSERSSLHRLLEQEAERQKGLASMKLEKILLFLTIITVFSVIYDLTQLLKEFFGAAESLLGYRIIVGVCVVLTLGAVWAIMKGVSFRGWRRPSKNKEENAPCQK